MCIGICIFARWAKVASFFIYLIERRVSYSASCLYYKSIDITSNLARTYRILMECLKECDLDRQIAILLRDDDSGDSNRYRWPSAHSTRLDVGSHLSKLSNRLLQRIRYSRWNRMLAMWRSVWTEKLCLMMKTTWGQWQRITVSSTFLAHSNSVTFGTIKWPGVCGSENNQMPFFSTKHT